MKNLYKYIYLKIYNICVGKPTLFPHIHNTFNIRCVGFSPTPSNSLGHQLSISQFNSI